MVRIYQNLFVPQVSCARQKVPLKAQNGEVPIILMMGMEINDFAETTCYFFAFFAEVLIIIVYIYLNNGFTKIKIILPILYLMYS